MSLGRLLKKGHLRRDPARSPSRGRGKESLLICRGHPYPSVAAFFSILGEEENNVNHFSYTGMKVGPFYPPTQKTTGFARG